MHFKTRLARKLYMKREAAIVSIISTVASRKEAGVTAAYCAPDTTRLSEDPMSFKFLAPHPGLATRRPALKQAKTSRGHSIFRGNILFHESLLELRVSYRLQTWHGVREIHSQYPRVTYIDDDGRTRSHTFDYFVVFENGWRLAIAVKMDRKRHLMLDMLSRIEEGGISEKDGPRLADETRLMTERDGSVASFHNCSEILASRETCSPAAECELREIVCRMTGRFRFMALLSSSRNAAARRAAVWRLIDLGELVPEGTGLINELTFLVRDTVGSVPSEPAQLPTARNG